MRTVPGCMCPNCKDATLAEGAKRFQELLALARKAYELLTPEQRQAADRAQRVSWVKGTLMLGGMPEVQAEAVAKTAVRQAEKEKE